MTATYDPRPDWYRDDAKGANITVEVGTEVPLGGATGLKLVGHVVKLDGDSAKVECPWFTRWYPVTELRGAIYACR